MLHLLRWLPMRLSVALTAVLSAALLVVTLPYVFAQVPDHPENKRTERAQIRKLGDNSSAASRHREHKRAERAQIIALEHKWQSATLSDDIPAMDQLLSEDYLGITANGEVLTKAQQLDRMRERRFILTKLEISDTKIKLVWNVAIVTCLAYVEGSNGGVALNGYFRYTRVYQQMHDGSWKVTNFEITPRRSVPPHP